MSDGAQGERRFCPACGQPVAGDAFCTRCGARIAPAAPVPQPPIAQPPVAPAPTPTPVPVFAPGPTPAPVARRKRHGCLIGCLVVLLVPLLACGGLATYLTLRPSAAEDVLSAPPDEEAAVTLTGALAERGIPTESAEVWVFPMADGGGSVAYCTVDLALASGDTGQPMPEYFIALGASDAAREAGVTRVVLEIVDDSGQVLAVTTTDAASCAAYADGSLDYEGFLATMDGRVGPGMVTMWLGE